MSLVLRGLSSSFFRLTPLLLLTFALGTLSGCEKDEATPEGLGGAGGASTGDPSDWEIQAQNRRLGKGLNLGNRLDAPEEGEWAPKLSEEDFEQAASGGFDSVRLPIRWSAHLMEDGFTIDSKFLKRVDWAIEEALSRDLRIVIDVHHFDEAMADPELNREVVFRIWEQLSEHYKQAGPELYFELLNEPKEQLTNEIWGEWLPDLVELVRETNPRRSLIVGGDRFNSISGLLGLDWPEDDYLIATFHYYSPFEFTHQDLPFVEGSEAWTGTAFYGSDAEVTTVQYEFDQVADWQKASGVPVYMGEFAAGTGADHESRIRYYSLLAREASMRDFSFAVWEDDGGFSLKDDSDELDEDFLEAFRDPAGVFESTRTDGPPEATIPEGPEVLIDDFENEFGDGFSQARLSYARAQALGEEPQAFDWVVGASPDVEWFSAQGTRIFPYDPSDFEDNFFEGLDNDSWDNEGLSLSVQLSGEYPWADVNTGLGGEFGVDWFDLRELTAVSFWARGTGSIEVGFFTRVVAESYPDGESWGHFTSKIQLREEWHQHVILAEDLAPRQWSPSEADGLTWEKSSEEVTGIDFIVPGDYLAPVEFRLDDLKLHGVTHEVFGFED